MASTSTNKLTGTFASATYADGTPLDQVHYLECKLILKPDRFVSAATFWDYAKLIKRAADKSHVVFTSKYHDDVRPRIREVAFFDTRDFSLYNNSFILRRRVAYEDGFPIQDPEIVFKFRHPNFRTAAILDVRPSAPVDYRIKFKAEALPLRDRIGGYRMLFSHNVEFVLGREWHLNGRAVRELAEMFPALNRLKDLRTKKIDLVNHTIVEEVLQELGKLEFGKGVSAKCNASLWRERGDHNLLAGEFSFELKFRHSSELHQKAVERCKLFFTSLQELGRDWLSLGTTKTAIVYRLKGNPPQAHE